MITLFSALLISRLFRNFSSFLVSLLLEVVTDIYPIESPELNAFSAEVQDLGSQSLEAQSLGRYDSGLVRLIKALLAVFCLCSLLF